MRIAAVVSESGVGWLLAERRGTGIAVVINIYNDCVEDDRLDYFGKD